MRVIDADRLKTVLEKNFGHTGGAVVLAQLIDEQPTVDVVEVRHGKWIPKDPKSDVIFICSECETEISTSWDYDEFEMWSYCPNCGAKMDGGDE